MDLKYLDAFTNPSMGAKTSAPIEKQIIVDDSNKMDDISSSLSKIMAFMESHMNTENEIPPGYDNTILNEKQTTDVVTMLLEFQDKYFSATPLSDKLERRFVWNIPLNVYKAAMLARDKEWPDCLNPLYWFYIFCTAEPGDMLGRFMITAVTSISDKEYDQLSAHADEYDELYSESDNSTVD